MTTKTVSELQDFLDGGAVAPEVYELRGDYRALLLATDGLEPGPSDEASESLLREAEQATARALADTPVDQLPHIAAWREAYRAFGAKPQRTRNSLEALTRRAADGLPRINRLTDLYNAISVLHQLPVGGEDLAHYVSSPRLIRATGTEPFDTAAGGEAVIEHPDAGEVVWCDDGGVTCRRWNWRQCRRTQLSESTTSALFVLDALGPMSDEALTAVADDLSAKVAELGPDVRIARRLFAPSSAAE